MVPALAPQLHALLCLWSCGPDLWVAPTSAPSIGSHAVILQFNYTHDWRDLSKAELLWKAARPGGLFALAACIAGVEPSIRMLHLSCQPVHTHLLIWSVSVKQVFSHHFVLLEIN